MHRSMTLVAALVVVVATAGLSHAIPQVINFQAILLNSGGTPITTTTNVDFAIWDQPSGGAQLWAENRNVTPNSIGNFSILLGSTTPIPDSVFSGDAYLAIKVSGDPELSPRTRIVSVGYAFRTGSVDGARGGNITSEVSIGPSNTLTGDNAFTAGTLNFAQGSGAMVLGVLCGAGGPNSAALGGYFNGANDTMDVVVGGINNRAQGRKSSVLGGASNIASGYASSVGGGMSNTAQGEYSHVGGGRANFAQDLRGTIGGGSNNTTDNQWGTIGGGEHNRAAMWATVSGGQYDTASGQYASVGGGTKSRATGYASRVGGGIDNRASGYASTVPGGSGNLAIGSHSVAAGHNAVSIGNYGITLSSYRGDMDTLYNLYPQIVLGARCGVYITSRENDQSDGDSTKLITTFGGAYLSGNGTTWTNASDRNQKENFTPVDRAALLDRIARLPIERWNYKTEGDEVQHIGPVAQDFKALFNVGADDKSISTIDPAGIALAAIQELEKRTRRIDELESEMAELREMVRTLSQK